MPMYVQDASLNDGYSANKLLVGAQAYRQMARCWQ